MEFDFSIFVGRFHPLFVHLPIGIIIVTLVLELIGKTGRLTLSWMWLISFLSALFAIFTGYQLSLDGNYASDALFWHKWLGIAVTCISFLLWIITKFTEGRKGVFSTVLKAGLIIVLSIGGHIGGQLTHGDNYLVEAAPEFIKKLMGYKTPEHMDLSSISTDSLIVYEHFIYPILDQKCVECHNASSANGNFDMSTPEAMMLGGDGGEVIIPGNSLESELFRRVTLNQSNIKFMPSKGIPMTYFEMELLKWWIDNEANFTQKASEQELDENIVASIFNLYKVDLSPRPWYEKEKGPEFDSSAVTNLISNGFIVNDMSDSDFFLEVEGNGNDQLDFTGLEGNVFILDLKNSNVSSEEFAKISSLENLLRLELNGSEANSAHVLAISPLPRLESINLFDTEVDDEGLNHLVAFPSLKRVYTWQSKITTEGIENFKNQRPDVEVIGGIN